MYKLQLNGNLIKSDKNRYIKELRENDFLLFPAEDPTWNSIAQDVKRNVEIQLENKNGDKITINAESMKNQPEYMGEGDYLKALLRQNGISEEKINNLKKYHQISPQCFGISAESATIDGKDYIFNGLRGKAIITDHPDGNNWECHLNCVNSPFI